MEDLPLREDSTESGELEDEHEGDTAQPQPAREDATESGALEEQ